jgi:hypothetical protein
VLRLFDDVLAVLGAAALELLVLTLTSSSKASSS